MSVVWTPTRPASVPEGRRWAGHAGSGATATRQGHRTHKDGRRRGEQLLRTTISSDVDRCGSEVNTWDGSVVRLGSCSIDAMHMIHGESAAASKPHAANSRGAANSTVGTCCANHAGRHTHSRARWSEIGRATNVQPPHTPVAARSAGDEVGAASPPPPVAGRPGAAPCPVHLGARAWQNWMPALSLMESCRCRNADTAQERASGVFL